MPKIRTGDEFLEEFLQEEELKREDGEIEMERIEALQKLAENEAALSHPFMHVTDHVIAGFWVPMKEG